MRVHARIVRRECVHDRVRCIHGWGCSCLGWSYLLKWNAHRRGCHGCDVGDHHGDSPYDPHGLQACARNSNYVCDCVLSALCIGLLSYPILSN